MKKIHVVLIVMAAMLPLVFLLLAAASFVLLPIVLQSMAPTRPVAAVLVYEIDPPDTLVNMQSMVAAVDRRVNPGWSKRGRVRQIGDRRIEVGVFSDDPGEVRRINRLVTSIGTLEFRVLTNNHDHASIIAKAKSEDGSGVHDEDGNLLARWVPVVRGNEDGFSYPEIAKRETDRAGEKGLEVLVVNDRFNVNGGYLTNALAGVDHSGRPCINITFNRQGGRLFAALTSNNLPDEVQDFSRKLGIILNGHLYSAPAIRSTIGERAQITGDFTREEVQDLVDVLSAGSLPAGLRRVGSSGGPSGAGSRGSEASGEVAR